MKRILFSISCVISVVLYSRYIDDPLNSLVSFMIAGNIPGTNIILGLWPSLGLALLALFAIRQFVRHIRFKMLENTARQITDEKLQADFKQSNDVAFDKSRRSAVAAPTTNSTSI